MTPQEAHVVFVCQLRHVQKRRAATLGNHERSFIRFQQFATQIHSFSDITVKLVHQFFLDGSVKRGWGAHTMVTHHKNLNSFFRWAVDNGLTATNPFELVEKPRLPRTLPKSLSQEDALRLLEATNLLYLSAPFSRQRNRAILAMLLFTGMRKSELFTLMNADVDLMYRVLHVRHGKGSSDRSIPITDRLLAILSDYVDLRRRHGVSTPYFFTSERGDRPMSETTLKRLINRLKKHTGISFYPHMLRHTFATLMLESGCDIYSISKMLGHSDVRTTSIYLSASVEHLRGVLSHHPLNSLV